MEAFHGEAPANLRLHLGHGSGLLLSYRAVLGLTLLRRQGRATLSLPAAAGGGMSGANQDALGLNPADLSLHSAKRKV